jgi:carbonic anhydrase
MFGSLLFLSALVDWSLACPDHNILLHENGIHKRAEGSQDWTYEASYNWGMINQSGIPNVDFQFVA